MQRNQCCYQHKIESLAVNGLIDLTSRNPKKERLPCAILGAARSAVSVPMAIMNSIEGYPQISHFSTSTQLDDKSQYKLFSRVIPSDDGTTEAIILYLTQKLKITHFGVLHTDDSYGMGYVTSLQSALRKLAPEIVMHNAKIPFHQPTNADIKNALAQLKSTNFRYFLAVINYETYSEIMTEAISEFGIAGPGYQWIFSDTLWPDFFLDDSLYENNAQLAIATKGVSVLSVVGGLPNMGMTVYDNFAKAWKTLNNDDDINYLQSKIPGGLNVKIEDLLDGPSTDASLMYDVTVALGLGACKAKKDRNYFTGEGHYLNTLQSPFIGATGNVTFDMETGSRDPMSAFFMFTNIQQVGNNESDSKSMFKAVPSDLFQGGEWKRLSPYVFSDGSTVPPSELTEVTVDYNYLSVPLQIVGFALCATLLLTSIAFGIWTGLNRKKKVVQASQTFFLLLMCLGTIFMAISMIPLSVDDKSFSPESCSVACMAVPWLFFVGFSIAIAALFTKMWKLNQLFKSAAVARFEVENKDVKLPLAVITLANFFVLVLWNIISPSRWVRTISVVDVFGRTISSVGSCSSKYEMAFDITIVVINLVALSITLYQAYTARHIRTVLDETEYSGLASAFTFLVFLMGIPIKFLVTQNPNARYFVNLLIIFVPVMSFIYLIFWPRFKFQRQLDRGGISIESVVRRFSHEAEKYAVEHKDIARNVATDIRRSLVNSMHSIHEGNS